MKSTVVGCFELVALPEFGCGETIAKIDTGAYSGALHCTQLAVVQDKQGQSAIQFALFDKPDVLYTKTSYVKRQVRSTNGLSDLRYLIDTTITIQGQVLPIRIGLSDRTHMKSTILIGRRFLRDNNFVVDVARNQQYDEERNSSL